MNSGRNSRRGRLWGCSDPPTSGREKMPARFLPVAAVLLGGLLAACGSNSKTATPAANQPPQSASSGGGAYGSGSSSASSGASTPSAALVITKKDKKLGMILAEGAKKLTVYEFLADKGGTSHCTGACATAWPPVTGTPKAGA